MYQACPCPSCDTLQADYQQALQLAKSCNPMLSVEQCTTAVPNGLLCPCDTHINSASEAYVNTLSRIRNDWLDMGCGSDIDCPDVECETPAMGSCMPQGSSNEEGSCS